MNSTPVDIIIIGPAHPYRGGLAAFNERLAKAFVKQAYTVEIVTFTLQYPKIFFPGKTQFSSEKAPDDLIIHRQINTINPFNWFSVRKWINSKNPKLVLTAFWLPLIGFSQGFILRGINKHSQKIALVHNMIPHEKRIGDRFLSKYFAHSCDAFITLSSKVSQEVASFTTDPIVTAHHPVYDSYGEKVAKASARKSLKLDLDKKYILFFGYIREYKGLDLLLRAMADTRLIDINLIVAGEFYNNQKKYEDLIQELDIADRLTLHTQFIPNDQVKMYFSAADLIVQPYKTASQSGISQLAYHFEKPMVVTDVGGLKEIVDDSKTGYVVDTKPSSIAQAIHDFYSQGDMERFKLELIEAKKRFSWESFIKKLESLMHK